MLTWAGRGTAMRNGHRSNMRTPPLVNCHVLIANTKFVPPLPSRRSTRSPGLRNRCVEWEDSRFRARGCEDRHPRTRFERPYDHHIPWWPPRSVTSCRRPMRHNSARASWMSRALTETRCKPRGCRPRHGRVHPFLNDGRIVEETSVIPARRPTDRMSQTITSAKAAGTRRRAIRLWRSDLQVPAGSGSS